MDGLSLTRKQYYSRVNKLIRTGLIQRRHGTFILTAFGKVIYSVSLIFSKAIDNRWKFKAIEVMKEKNKLTSEEYQKATNLLLTDEKFEEIIFNKM